MIIFNNCYISTMGRSPADCQEMRWITRHKWLFPLQDTWHTHECSGQDWSKEVWMGILSRAAKCIARELSLPWQWEFFEVGRTRWGQCSRHRFKSHPPTHAPTHSMVRTQSIASENYMDEFVESHLDVWKASSMLSQLHWHPLTSKYTPFLFKSRSLPQGTFNNLPT
jgi:hypothetical protein